MEYSDMHDRPEGNLHKILSRLGTRGSPTKVPGSPAPRRISRRVMRLTFASLTFIGGLSLLAASLSYWIFATPPNLDHRLMRETIIKLDPPYLTEQRAAREYLIGCVTVLSHWALAIEPTSTRSGLSEKCTAFANRQAQWDGYSSEGALARAYGHWHTGNYSASLRQLDISRDLAPRDLWSAIHRVQLTLKLVPKEDLADYQEAFGLEFSLLTATNRGIQTAVELYLRHPSLRPALLDIAQDMTPQDRLRFLNSIKKRLGN